MGQHSFNPPELEAALKNDKYGSASGADGATVEMNVPLSDARNADPLNILNGVRGSQMLQHNSGNMFGLFLYTSVGSPPKAWSQAILCPQRCAQQSYLISSISAIFSVINGLLLLLVNL